MEGGQQRAYMGLNTKPRGAVGRFAGAWRAIASPTDSFLGAADAEATG